MKEITAQGKYVKSNQFNINVQLIYLCTNHLIQPMIQIN